MLNKIWVLQSLLTNYFVPQQKLISKVRDGAKLTKTYDTATTPHRRAQAHNKVTEQDKTIMTDTLAGLNPAAVQRQIQGLTAELLTLTTSKASELPLKPWRLLHGGRAVLQGQVLARRVVALVAGELLAEDDFLTARAGAAGTEALAGPVAVGAPLLAEIATLALTAGVDGAVAA